MTTRFQTTFQRVHGLWMMARPLQLLAVTLVYLWGVLLAGDASVSAFAWGLVALLPIAVSIHYANEYADSETDALTSPTPFSGGSGAIPAGYVTRRDASRAMRSSLVIGVMLAGTALLLGELSFLACVVLAIGAFFGWMYSLPPLRLAWNGWGEVTNAFLGGWLLAIYGVTVAGVTLNLNDLSAFVPFAALTFLNLLATQYPDRHADAQVGKRTLPVRLSKRQIWRVYGLGLFVFVWFSLLSWTMLISFMVLPFAVAGWFTFTRSPHLPVVTMVVYLLLSIGLVIVN